MAELLSQKTNYVHVAANGDCEVGFVDDLLNYSFNRKHIGNLYRSDLPPNIFEKIMLLIVSIDSFNLPFRLIPFLRHLKAPICLNICDTHHGNLPITSILQFARRSKPVCAILRFNQRHAYFLRQAGVKTFCTIISPDLVEYVKNNRINFQDKSYGTENKKAMNQGIFVGSLSTFHDYRKYLLQQMLSENLPLSLIRTNGPDEMIAEMSKYSWSLNVPLNGDFNRRFIEIISAGCAVVTEKMPKSQMIGPFKDILNSCFTFGDHHELRKFTDSPYLVQHYRDRGRACLEALQSIEYDRSIIRSMINYIANSSRINTISIDLLLSEEILEYQYLQNVSLRAHLLERHTQDYISKNFEKSKFLGKFSLEEEFPRLSRFLN